MKHTNSSKIVSLLILAIILLAVTSCNPDLKIGDLRTESSSVELGDADSVRVEITFGAGDLQVSGGSEKLLEGDFTYNVDLLKPEVKYRDDTLVIGQPEAEGIPSWTDIGEFRNEWSLRLNDQVPMDLSVNMGGGTNDLKLAGLSLTGLDIILGAGESTIDLSGDWERDMDVNIDAGAADLNILLPGDVGVRVRVESGPHTIETTGLTKDGEYYTNAVYGTSDVTMQVEIDAGIGFIDLEVAQETAATSD